MNEQQRLAITKRNQPEVGMEVGRYQEREQPTRYDQYSNRQPLLLTIHDDSAGKKRQKGKEKRKKESGQNGGVRYGE